MAHLCGWRLETILAGLPSSNQTQDERGVVSASCRHSAVLGSVNMYRGEKFAYGHYLQRLFKNVYFFASDVVCKYWPRAQRVAGVWPEYSLGGTQPFLSVMHAAGYAYYSQVTSLFPIFLTPLELQKYSDLRCCRAKHQPVPIFVRNISQKNHVCRS